MGRSGLSQGVLVSVSALALFACSTAPKTSSYTPPPASSKSASSTVDSSPGVNAQVKLDLVGDIDEKSLIWVQRPDGTTTCKSQKAEALESAALILREESIPIYGAKHSHDGKQRTEICGIATGWMNTYRIPLSKITRAYELGFEEVEIPDVIFKSPVDLTPPSKE